MVTVPLPNRFNEIAKAILTAPDFKKFISDEEYMDYVIPLMNDVLYLLDVGLSLAHDEDEANEGLPRNPAIVLGHMVRLRKLYEGFLKHIADRQAELAAIFVRLIYETIVRVDYLFDAEPSSFDSYILTSYKAEKEKLEDLDKKESERPLNDIEQRIKTKIMNRLNSDGISKEALMANRNWKLDGKHFKAILEHLNREEEYSYLFGSGSHFVHGGWYEISLYHLFRHSDKYTPNLNFNDPDPRLACPISALCLNQMEKFIAWNETDPSKVVGPLIHKLCEHFRKIDAAHEKFYQRKNET